MRLIKTRIIKTLALSKINIDFVTYPMQCVGMGNGFDNSWDLYSFRDQVSGNGGPNGRLLLIITNHKHTHSVRVSAECTP